MVQTAAKLDWPQRLVSTGAVAKRVEGGSPMRRRDLLAFGAAMLSAQLWPGGVLAQSKYPDRPVRLIVPFPPGGAYDTVGRPWAERMKNLLGTIVIENIGGAGGGVGAAQASRQRPDG